MRSDPFLNLARPSRPVLPPQQKGHEGRAHSKFSASGFERIRACPGSVALSEGLTGTTSLAALEGTRCHEVLERILTNRPYHNLKPTLEMVGYAEQTAKAIRSSYLKVSPGSELLIETKVSLAFIHPEAFGTLDAAVVEHFGTLNIQDFKFGTHLVKPERNDQLIFYALGVAYEYSWNFKKVRLTIHQPRARGYDGPSFWEMGIFDLKKYIDDFKRVIDRAENEPNTYVEGSHCFFCIAKGKCPLKREGKLKKAQSIFSRKPLTNSF